MDNNPVRMGGILDLATTQSDIFLVKSDNNETSPEIHDNMYQQNFSDSKTTDQWSDYDEGTFNKNDFDSTNKLSNCDVKIKQKNIDQPSDLPLHTSGPMNWSVSSSVVETPGDSGVQCLDSETSDLTGDCPAGMTLSLVEAEELTCDSTCEIQNKQRQEIDGENQVVSPLKNKNFLDAENVMTQSDIENQNTCSIDPLNNNISCDDDTSIFKSKNSSSHDQLVTQEGNDHHSSSSSNNIPKSAETMKSASDDIVFRRKCKKKSGSNQSQPKKRVSFHEDILNNTKTDNIHIEHGFISYRPEMSMNYFPNNYFKKLNGAIGRYSWCAVGDSPFPETEQNISNRNTKSDVLTYGRTDVAGYPDNSGIYEYENETKLYNMNKSCESETCINKIPPCKCSKEESQKSENNSPVNHRQLYMCSCSSSDSNLSSESETSSQTISLNSDTRIKYSAGTSKKCDNTQKSYSCDCIENNMMKPLVKTMYFSDANINNHSDKSDDQLQMSEILPKASCLKKSALKKKRYITTDVIEEHESSKNKREGDRLVKSLLDSKNLFGSLKNIYKNINFGLSIAERGVPEGSEDCQSVSEVLPTDTFRSEDSHLSKSFDTGLNYNYLPNNQNGARTGGDGFSRNYTHEVDQQLRGNYSNSDIFDSAPTPSKQENINRQSDVSKQNLSLDMNASNGKTFLDWKSQNNFANYKDMTQNSKWLRNKCIVNCESTVYEHKGVSYCYEYDAFQTTFDTSKDTFTPITDNTKTENVSSEKKVIQETIEPSSSENILSKENSFDKVEESKMSTDTASENEAFTEASDRTKFRHSRYLVDQGDSTKSGISRHLSSPLKQKNIMRYEKVSKPVSSNDGKENDSCFDTNSTQDTTFESADIDEILEIGDGFEITTKPTNRKMSLLNRFLKNVSQKKAFYTKLRENEFFQQKIKEESMKFPNICFPPNEKISSTFKVSAKYLDSMINKEVMENKRVSVKLMTADEPSYFDSFEENVAIECCEKLKLELFRNQTEILHRMLKVRSSYMQENGQWNPQLVFITDKALYVADVKSGQTSYNLICYLTHDKLNTIVIGPDSQYVQIFDSSDKCRCILITGDRYLCHRLVSSLEWSSRNSRTAVGSTVIHGSVPSVIWKDNECLRKSLLRTSSYDKYERCLFYGMVGNSAPSFNSGRSASPFGQAMEGFLMYKTERQRHWRPSFFLLKSGVLSYGSSTLVGDSSLLCLPHSIDLKTVIGVRRCTDINGRPYCFEIALNVGVNVLQMAAPDDDVASQWLQGLLMHAAQALEGPKTDPSKKMLPPCCTLLVTTKHIITLREDLEGPLKISPDDSNSLEHEIKPNTEEADAPDVQPLKNNIEILSFASIKDLTALKIPDNDDNWCNLEFVFCEVHEGTEMGFLFASSAELERFIAIVESLWHITNEGVFPISIQLSSDTTSSRCSERHNCLITAWDRLLPAAQR